MNTWASNTAQVVFVLCALQITVPLHQEGDRAGGTEPEVGVLFQTPSLFQRLK
jgi:hypothetical protein